MKKNYINKIISKFLFNGNLNRKRIKKKKLNKKKFFDRKD